MKGKIFILIYFVLLCSSCKSQQEQLSNNKEMYEIIFANGFVNDKVDLSINENEIVKSVFLTSDKSDGVTNFNLKVFVKGSEYVVLNSLTKKQSLIKSIRGEIKIKIFYKNVWYVFSPSEEKGKYIIIDAGLKFTQQMNEPIFD
ncbi:MAG: hypothetical protein ACOVOQ_09160 [Flavobacterium sp.]|jgi:hypothetical protein